MNYKVQFNLEINTEEKITRWTQVRSRQRQRQCWIWDFSEEVANETLKSPVFPSPQLFSQFSGTFWDPEFNWLDIIIILDILYHPINAEANVIVLVFLHFILHCPSIQNYPQFCGKMEQRWICKTTQNVSVILYQPCARCAFTRLARSEVSSSKKLRGQAKESCLPAARSVDVAYRS